MSILKRWFKTEEEAVKRPVKASINVAPLESRHMDIYLNENPLVVIKTETANGRHLFSMKMKELCLHDGYIYHEDTLNETITISTKDTSYKLMVDYYYEVHDGEIQLHMNEMVILFPIEDNEVDFSSAYHFLSTLFFRLI